MVALSPDAVGRRPATGCYNGCGLGKVGEGRPHPLEGRVGCKLNENAGSPKYIIAEPRVGYRKAKGGGAPGDETAEPAKG